MAVELLLPGRRLPAPQPPERIALNMAFGVGAGNTLGVKSRYRSHGAIAFALWVAGVHGRALDFNPIIPCYVTIPAAHTQLDFTTEDFSFVMRAIFDTILVTQELCMRGLENVDGWRWMLWAGQGFSFSTQQVLADQRSVSFLADLVAGAWLTLGVSRSGASILMYVNGIDRTRLNPAHIDPVTCARACEIGIHNDLLSRPVDGRIEFLRVFRGVALTTSEHLAWHNALA